MQIVVTFLRKIIRNIYCRLDPVYRYWLYHVYLDKQSYANGYGQDQIASKDQFDYSLRFGFYVTIFSGSIFFLILA